MYIICKYYIHRTDLADLSSFWEKIWTFLRQLSQYPLLLESEHLQFELTKFPVFSLCLDKIPCVFPVFWQNFQIPCVFPDRDFLWPFSLFSLCSGYPAVNAWIPIHNLSFLLRSHPHPHPRPAYKYKSPLALAANFNCDISIVGGGGPDIVRCSRCHLHPPLSPMMTIDRKAPGVKGQRSMSIAWGSAWPRDWPETGGGGGVEGGGGGGMGRGRGWGTGGGGGGRGEGGGGRGEGGGGRGEGEGGGGRGEGQGQVEEGKGGGRSL